MDLDKKVNDLENTVKELTAYIKGQNDKISSVLSNMNDNFGAVNKQLNSIEADIKIINAKIDKLDGSTTDGLGKVNTSLVDLRGEISKINDVTGYDQIFANNLKVIGK